MFIISCFFYTKSKILDICDVHPVLYSRVYGPDILGLFKEKYIYIFMPLQTYCSKRSVQIKWQPPDVVNALLDVYCFYVLNRRVP
jgi:hypothetical protein